MTGGDSGSTVTGDLVKAATIDGTPIAEEIRTRLDEAGITATLQADSAATDGAALGGVMSKIDIMVPSGDLERARGVIAQVGQEDGVQPDES